MYVQIKRILSDEFYCGTLIDHKSETSGIHKTFRFTKTDEQIRHENFVPAIVTREQWKQANKLMSERLNKRMRIGTNQRLHRYSGLLKCANCGSVFATKIRYHKDGPPRYEYNCNGYHRYGKAVCSSHKINQDVLDKFIYDELKLIKRQARRNWSAIDSFIQQWSSRKTDTAQKIERMKEKIATLEADIECILMERIRDKSNAERYDRMLAKREADVRLAHEQIANLHDMDAMVQRKKAEMKRSIDLIDEIAEGEAISDAHLRMLVEKILITETSDGKLNLEICMKAAFRAHYDEYDELLGLVDRGFEIGCGSVTSDEVLDEYYDEIDDCVGV